MSQSHLIYQVSSSRPEMEKLCQEHAKENGFAISTCGSRRDSALYHAKNGGFCNNHELSYQGEDRYTYAANVRTRSLCAVRRPREKRVVKNVVDTYVPWDRMPRMSQRRRRPVALQAS